MASSSKCDLPSNPLHSRTHRIIMPTPIRSGRVVLNNCAREVLPRSDTIFRITRPQEIVGVERCADSRAGRLVDAYNYRLDWTRRSSRHCEELLQRSNDGVGVASTSARSALLASR